MLITRVTQPSCDIRQPHSNSMKVQRLRGGTATSKNVIHSESRRHTCAVNIMGAAKNAHGSLVRPHLRYRIGCANASLSTQERRADV